MANEKDATDDRVRIVKTLESKLIQNAVGSNLVKTNPYLYAGQLGFQSAESVYAGILSGDEAKKEKDALYKERQGEGAQLGVFGEPAYPSDYDLSVKLARQLDEVLQLAKLSELEKAAKAVGAKLSFEVPKELQDYISVELMQKAIDKKTGKVDIKSLSEKEQHAFMLYQTLSESYKRACALKTTQTNYFSDLDEQGKKIADFYKPKEEKK
jgi:hypothetical protein